MRWQQKKMGSHLSGNEVSWSWGTCKAICSCADNAKRTSTGSKKENEKVSFRNVRVSFDTGDLILFFFPSEIMSSLRDVRYLYGALCIKGEEQVNLLPLFGVGPLCLWVHNKTIY